MQQIKNNFYAEHGKKIISLVMTADRAVVFEKVELSMVVKTFSKNVNVYDPSEISLDIRLTSQNQTEILLPGFYYVPHGFKPTGEIIGPTGEDAAWRFRIMLTEPGQWDFTVTLREKGEVTDTVTGNLIAEMVSDTRGILGIEPIHRRNFMFQNGELYIPIGINLCWAFPVKSTEKQARYITRILRQGKPYGMNFIRLWMAYWSLSIPQKNDAPNDFTNGQYNAAQLDKIFDSLHETDIYTSLVIFTHGMFSRKANPVWGDNPYNKANSKGYLEEPGEFFTNQRAKQDARCLIRYLIARYGYSRNIMTWEIFNEADIAEGDMQEKIAWHKETADFIRAIDPYHHMVTSSGAYADCPLSREDMFDFTYIHWYDYSKIRDVLNFQKNDWAAKKRPSFYGEIGMTKCNPHIDEDLITVHQTNWAGVMGGAGATFMPWYWEQFDRVDGYSDFEPLSKFSAQIPWTALDFSQLDTADLHVNNKQAEIIGYGGDSYAYLWMYDDGYNHHTKEITEFTDVSFEVPLSDGNYLIEWICPWKGDIVQTKKQKASNGKLSLCAPVWTRDLAVKIVKS